MKLKKLLALALSGVLAVSMFAGCAKADVKPEDPTDEPDTPASSAAYAEMLKSELTGSAKAMVTPVADADLDAALKNAVDKYFDYNSGFPTDVGIDGDWFIKFDDLADYRNDKVGAAVISTMGAKFDTITAFDNTLTKTESAVEVYALPASTSDAYALEMLAEKIDEATSNLPKEGGFDNLNKDKANYDYDYTVAVSIETRTVTFAGVEQGVKYVAFMMTNNVTEKA